MAKRLFDDYYSQARPAPMPAVQPLDIQAAMRKADEQRSADLARGQIDSPGGPAIYNAPSTTPGGGLVTFLGKPQPGPSPYQQAADLLKGGNPGAAAQILGSTGMSPAQVTQQLQNPSPGIPMQIQNLVAGGNPGAAATQVAALGVTPVVPVPTLAQAPGLGVPGGGVVPRGGQRLIDTPDVYGGTAPPTVAEAAGVSPEIMALNISRAQPGASKAITPSPAPTPVPAPVLAVAPPRPEVLTPASPVNWQPAPGPAPARQDLTPATLQPAASAPQPAAVPTAPAAVPASTPPTLTPRPTSQAVADAVNQYRALIGQASLTEQDILNSPSFQAQQRALDFQQQVNESALRKRLAAQGILGPGSTPAAQALGAENARIQAQRDAALAQQIQAEYTRRQQEIANAQGLIGTLSGLEGQSFSQGLAEFQTLAPYSSLTLAQQVQARMEQDRFNENIRQFGLEYALRQQEADRAARVTGAEITGLDPVTGRPTYPTTQADRQFGLQQAGVTGEYQGSSTLAAQVAEANRKAQEAGLTGVYQGAPTLAGRADTRAQAEQEALLPSRLRQEEAQASEAETRAKAANEGLWRDIEWFKTHPFEDRELQRRAAAAETALKEEEARVAADPAYGTSATARAKIDQIRSQIDDLKAQAAQRLAQARQGPKVSVAAQRNAVAAEIKAAKNRGMTYDKVIEDLQRDTNQLGDVPLNDAVEDAKAIYGITKPTASQESMTAANDFAANVVAGQKAGRTYEQAVAALNAKAAQLPIPYTTALDLVDRVYRKGRYAPGLFEDLG